MIYRLLVQQKKAVLLNLLCLSVGFAVLFVVLKQVKYDFSFDTCYPKGENIYQMGYFEKTSDKHEVVMAYPALQEYMKSLPEIEAYTIIWCGVEEWKTDFYYKDQVLLWWVNRIFVRLVGIGFVIACPLAYWLVNSWLNAYPYRTPIYAWVFLFAFLLTLLITMITVGYRSWKAANENPVDAIKTE